MDFEEMLISWEKFFNSDVIWIVALAILSYIALLWVALIVWVARDSVSRSSSLLFHIFAILLNICLPLFGLLVYLIIRPSKTLTARYYEEMEYRALLEGISGTLTACPKCGETVGADFAFCPKCSYNLRKQCSSCHRLYDIDFELCPYCGTKAPVKSEKKEAKKEEKPETKK